MNRWEAGCKVTMRSTRNILINRRDFLKLSTGAIGISVAAGCGGGSGGGPAAGGGGAISDDTRLAVFSAVGLMADALPHTSLAADSLAIQQYLQSRPEVDVTIIAPDGNVWARFTDGFLFGVFNNVIPDIATAKSVAKGRDAELPSTTNASLFYAFGQGLTSAVSEIGGYLGNEGYSATISQNVDVEDLKEVNNTTGVFYIDAHGGLFYTDVGTRAQAAPNSRAAMRSAAPRDLFFQPSPVSFALSTSTLVSKANLSTYAQDWKNGRMIAVLAPNGVVEAGSTKIVRRTIWCVTEKFVTQYMSFAKNSFVFINACTSYNDPFRLACLSKGAGVYVGWSQTIGDTPSYEVAKIVFDELLGSNVFVQQVPRQRPFDWPAIYGALVSEHMDKPDASRPDSQLLYFTNTTAGSGDFAILAPTVSQVQPAEKSLTISGTFGTEQGTVTVGGAAANVTSWTSTSIVCDLPPAGDAGGSGDVVVTAKGLKSNAVRLTVWPFTINYTSTTYSVSNPDQTGTYVVTLTIQLMLRGDVHPQRLQPEQTAVSGWHGFETCLNPTKMAKITAFNISGSVNYTVRSSNPDIPDGHYTETTTPNGSAPYLLDGSDPNFNPFSGDFTFAGVNIVDPDTITVHLQSVLPDYTTKFSNPNIQSSGFAYQSFGSHPIYPAGNGTLTLKLDTNYNILPGSTASSDGGTFSWSTSAPLASTAPDPHAAS